MCPSIPSCPFGYDPASLGVCRVHLPCPIERRKVVSAFRFLYLGPGSFLRYILFLTPSELSDLLASNCSPTLCFGQNLATYLLRCDRKLSPTATDDRHAPPGRGATNGPHYSRLAFHLRNISVKPRPWSLVIVFVRCRGNTEPSYRRTGEISSRTAFRAVAGPSLVFRISSAGRLLFMYSCSSCDHSQADKM